MQSCPAPQAWAEATVRLAMQFTQGKGPAFAGAASVALADEVVGAIVVTKLKLSAIVILAAGVLLSGATAWTMLGRKAGAPVVANSLATPPEPAEPKVAQEKAAPLPDFVTRTIRGSVCDEQGRPVAKAWIGSRVEWRDDTWSIVEPLDRIRERTEPFRDEQGNVVPAGALGKYFELRDQDGKWQPIHPANVRRYEDPGSPRGLSSDRDAVRRHAAATLAAMQGQVVVEVRNPRRWFEMVPDFGRHTTAHRTDPQGNFSIEVRVSTYKWEVLHFASPDFSQEASLQISPDFPDAPIEVTLKPARRVRARVTAKLSDGSSDEILRWQIDRVESGAAERDQFVAEPMDRQTGHLEPSGTDRCFQLETRLHVGRYALRFDAGTQYRIVDLVVPRGDGPLEVPDIELKTFAWFGMLGKQAAEIDAVDLDGKRVTLAELQGKVVVLVFWSTASDFNVPMLRYLADIQERFKSQPLAILALHDASIESPESLKKALAAMPDNAVGNRPIRILLDRAPIDTVAQHDGLAAGAVGSGRTADIYQNWVDGAEFVIDRSGVFVTASVLGLGGSSTYYADKDGRIKNDDDLSLQPALEDLFGLPRSPVDEPELDSEPPSRTSPIPKNKVTRTKGKVVDLDGKAIALAKVWHKRDFKRESAVESDANGEFILSNREPKDSVHVLVEASGFALKDFKLSVGEENRTDQDVYSSIDATGVVRHPLRLGRGVEVTGRLLKNGKPVAGGLIGVKYVEFKSDPTPLNRQETKVNSNGIFRLPHLAPDADFWVYSKLGSLADGGTVIPVRVRTTGDGSTLHVGELQVVEGRTLSGRLVRSDGQPIPGELEVSAGCASVSGELWQRPGPAGQFEFKGLPDGSVSLVVTCERGIESQLYRLSGKNRCLNPSFPCEITGRLDHDITTLRSFWSVVLSQYLIDPRVNEEVDPARVADFEEAKAGPITGVPPRP